MSINTFSKLVMAFCLGGLVACGDDDSNPVQNFVNEPDLNGRYSSECLGSDIADLGYQETFRFETDSTFVQYQDFYTAGNCGDQNVLGTVEIRGTYSVDSNGAPKSEGGAITLNLNKAFVKVNSETLATALNGVSFCGSEDYAEGKTTEITQGSDNNFCPVRNVPDTLYGVYREDNGQLYLNQDALKGMSQSKSDRPEELDRESVYNKQ